MRGNQKIRVLFSLLLIPTGSVMILLNIGGASGNLISNVGLALIVAGVVSSFHEIVLRRLEGDETAENVADKVHDKIKKAPLSAIGIRLVSPVRKGYAGYYLWAIDTTPQEMFFAGRSVLHRIDADFRVRDIGFAEEIIARRLKERSNLKVLLLDARSEMIARLAREEGQTAEQLMSDLATSIGICQRLYEILQKKILPPTARLEILIFDEIPYFAYHRVDSQVIVGFYFSSAVGHSSAAFEVVDPQTKNFFDQHFQSIYGRACSNYIIRTNPHSGKIELNNILIMDIRKLLIEKLGEDKTIKLMKGEVREKAS